MSVEVVDLDGRPAFSPAAGAAMRAVWGEDVLVNVVDLEPGAVVPTHAHPEEQLGLVVDGLLILRTEQGEHRLPAGFAYTIPGSHEHSGTAGPDGCRVIDVFRPLRADYRAAQVAADARDDRDAAG